MIINISLGMVYFLYNALVVVNLVCTTIIVYKYKSYYFYIVLIYIFIKGFLQR